LWQWKADVYLALCSSLVMRVLPTWPGWSAELAVMLPEGAKSAAAFLAAAFCLFILFFSCVCKKNNQAVDYCKAPTSLLPCIYRSSCHLRKRRKLTGRRLLLSKMLLLFLFSQSG